MVSGMLCITTTFICFALSGFLIFSSFASIIPRMFRRVNKFFHFPSCKMQFYDYNIAYRKNDTTQEKRMVIL